MGHETMFAGAGPFFETCCAIHIGCGSADIGDDAVESRHAAEAHCLSDDRLLAAGNHTRPLMDRYGAEIALPEASSMSGDGLFNSIQRTDFPGFVMGMYIALEIELIYLIQFSGRERRARWIMDQVSIPVSLH